MTEAELAAENSPTPNINTNGAHSDASVDAASSDSAGIDAASPNSIESDNSDNDDTVDESSPEAQLEKAFSYRIIKKQAQFWDERGDLLLQLIVEFLNDHTSLHKRDNADLIAKSAKALGEARVKAVDAAAKLIQFELPKLGALEVKNKNIHKFVVLAPRVCDNASQWLEMAKQDNARLEMTKQQAMRTILNPPTLDNKPIDVIEDSD